jgi:hypothetical protein
VIELLTTNPIILIDFILAITMGLYFGWDGHRVFHHIGQHHRLRAMLYTFPEQRKLHRDFKKQQKQKKRGYKHNKRR